MMMIDICMFGVCDYVYVLFITNCICYLTVWMDFFIAGCLWRSFIGGAVVAVGTRRCQSGEQGE